MFDEIFDHTSETNGNVINAPWLAVSQQNRSNVTAEKCQYYGRAVFCCLSTLLSQLHDCLDHHSAVDSVDITFSRDWVIWHALKPAVTSCVTCLPEYAGGVQAVKPEYLRWY